MAEIDDFDGGRNRGRIFVEERICDLLVSNKTDDSTIGSDSERVQTR